jgi:gliding motility-associated protein GldM
MAGGNLSPRQKMIGMMYLVLTALLALNVSKEILNAFVLVNDGLELTTKNFGEKNALTYKAFEKAKANNAAKVEKFYNKAQLAKQYSKELDKYIEELKVEIIMGPISLPKAKLIQQNLKMLTLKIIRRFQDIL